MPDKLGALFFLGTFTLSLALVADSLALTALGSALAAYAVAVWSLDVVRRKALEGSIEVSRKLSPAAKGLLAQAPIEVTVTVKNASGRTFDRVRALDHVASGIDDLRPASPPFTLPGRSRVELTYRLTPPKSGPLNFYGVTLYASDALGLTGAQKLFPLQELIVVYPNIQALGRTKTVKRVKLTLGGIVPYKALQRNVGVEYAGTRRYNVDDPLRIIEWKSTARTGVLMSKMVEGERPLTVVYVVDASISMLLGEARYSKLDAVYEVLATSAKLALEERNNVGAVVFDDSDVVALLPPSAAHGQLFRLLNAVAEAHHQARGKTAWFAEPRELINGVHHHLRSVMPELYGFKSPNLGAMLAIIRNLMESSPAPGAKVDPYRLLRTFAARAGLAVKVDPAKYAPGGKGGAVAAALASAQRMVKERALFVIFSDLEVAPSGFEQVVEAVKAVQARRHDVLVVHTPTYGFEAFGPWGSEGGSRTELLAAELLLKSAQRATRPLLTRLREENVSLIELTAESSLAQVFRSLLALKRLKRSRKTKAGKVWRQA